MRVSAWPGRLDDLGPGSGEATTGWPCCHTMGIFDRWMGHTMMRIAGLKTRLAGRRAFGHADWDPRHLASNVALNRNLASARDLECGSRSDVQ